VAIQTNIHSIKQCQAIVQIKQPLIACEAKQNYTATFRIRWQINSLSPIQWTRQIHEHFKTVPVKPINLTHGLLSYAVL